jgi:hypothetical protein
MIPTEGYPQLSTAIAAIAVLDRRDLRGHDIIYKRAQNAYANELLPALLPGQWRMTRNDVVWHLVGTSARPLFDHGASFRRWGARGPTTWESCAIISHPYHVLYDGKPDRCALDQITALANTASAFGPVQTCRRGFRVAPTS